MTRTPVWWWAAAVMTAAALAVGAEPATLFEPSDNDLRFATSARELPTDAISWNELALAVPPSLDVYRIAPGSATAQDAVKLAGRLGVSAADVEYDLSMSTFWVRDAAAGRTLVFEDSGSKWSYRDSKALGQSRRLADSGMQPALPTADEARQLAVQEMHALVGLEPGGEVDGGQPTVVQDTIVKADSSGTTNRSTPTKTYAVSSSVRFARLIDGYPAVGPGVKLYFDFGHERTLVGATYVWPMIEAWTTRPTLSVSEAIAAGKAGAGAENARGDCVSATVTAVSLGYYVPDPEDGTAVFPVYVFRGPCHGYDGAVISGAYAEYQLWIPAV